MHYLTITVLLIITMLVGVTHSAEPFQSWMYVSNAHSHSVSRYSVSGRGKDAHINLIEHILLLPEKTHSVSTPMAINKDGTELFIATRNKQPKLYRYGINRDSGELKLVGVQNIAHSYAYIALNAQQSALLAASYPQNLLSVYDIASDAAPVYQSSYVDYKNAHGIAIDHLNKHILMPALGDNQLHFFANGTSSLDAMDETFEIKHEGSTKFPDNTGPRHIAIHPKTNKVYIIGEFDATIYELTYRNAKYQIIDKYSFIGPDEMARIEDISTNPEKPYRASDIKISQDGSAMFAAERRSNTICSFVYDATVLAFELADCLPTEKSPRGIQISARHQLLFVAGEKSHHVSVYSYDSDANLTLVHRVSAQLSPNWIELVPALQ